MKARNRKEWKAFRFASSICTQGWYHVNTDVGILEPVDAECRPVPPESMYHTILVTNLAGKVQPIIRYDLGDSLLVKPNRCACGNPHPAIRVQGRAAEPPQQSDGGKFRLVIPLAKILVEGSVMRKLIGLKPIP